MFKILENFTVIQFQCTYLAETVVVKETQSLTNCNVLFSVISSHIAGLCSPVEIK